MKRVGGSRRKSRYKMRLSISDKGKLPLKRFLQSFENGDRVLLRAYPGHQDGLFDLKFHGKIGEVIGKQGTCYKVSIRDGNKLKACIVHPVHLNRA